MSAISAAMSATMRDRSVIAAPSADLEDAVDRPARRLFAYRDGEHVVEPMVTRIAAFEPRDCRQRIVARIKLHALAELRHHRRAAAKGALVGEIDRCPIVGSQRKPH